MLLGGPVGAATGARFAVKAHGSELEYAMRGNPALAAWGRDSLRGAEAVFVGSAHIRRVLEDVCGHVDGVHEVPPGVDIDDWRTAGAGSRRSPPSWPRRAATRRTPAMPRSGCPTTATRAAWSGSWPATGRPSSTSAS